MRRHPARPLIPILIALIALTVLTPTLATAQPHHDKDVRASVAPAEATATLLAKLQSALSILWSGTRSASSGLGAAITGDTGSVLEPDGSH